MCGPSAARVEWFEPSVQVNDCTLCEEIRESDPDDAAQSTPAGGVASSAPDHRPLEQEFSEFLRCGCLAAGLARCPSIMNTAAFPCASQSIGRARPRRCVARPAALLD